MISDSQFMELDAEIWGLIAPPEPDAPIRRKREAIDAALPEIEAVADADDERRIDRIIEKARFEAVMKDSVGFLFKTMGVGVSELTGATLAALQGEARASGAPEPRADASPQNEDPPEEA
jgi:hypothetical protein